MISAPRVETLPPREALWQRVAFLGLSCTLLFASHTHAGDILRGGIAAQPRNNGATAFSANPSITAQTRKNANDLLSRTNQSLQSVRAMQAAARAAAVAGPNHLGFDPNHPGQLLPTVPNGLAPNGLEVAPGVPKNLATPQPGENSTLWTGAALPTQSSAGGRTVVTIKQTVAQAVLNWKTLNVGKSTTLKFDQSAGGANQSQWIAFNKINDPSGSPTQILGQITGEGQAYLINQNGVLFGGSSQVNLRSLTVSSLPINDNLVKQGLLNNRDAQFLFSTLALPGGSDGTPNFTPTPPLTPSGRNGDVVIQAGAQLNIGANTDGNGGRALLVGANVRNEGTISTPAGQTILAAGLQVGLAPHSSTDPSLRGLDAWVGAVGDYAGTVTNTGLVTATTGSALFTGRSIKQLGAIESTTSVTLNGRIDLLASYNAVSNPNFDNVSGGGAGGPEFLYQSTGLVEFGPNSVTRILPDYASDKSVPGTALPEKSQINIEGLAVHLRSQSTLLAPSGEIHVRAGIWPYTEADGNGTVLDPTGIGEAQLANQYSGPIQKFLFSNGQIFLDSTALISVAGSVDVPVPLEQSILNVQFRGSEFADSPVQRDGPLRATPLTIDIRLTGISNGRYWMGTPLGDATGLAGLITRNAAQLTAAGGTVNLQAGQSIAIQSGATIDVSGGFFNHLGGVVKTSRLLQQGRLVNIDKALPGQVFDGVYSGEFTVNHPKYGVSQTYKAPWMTGERLDPGYTEGLSGGSLQLAAPSMALDGHLLGRTITSPQGRGPAPSLSQLSIQFVAEKALSVDPRTVSFLPTSPTPPAITFTRNTLANEVPAFDFAANLPTPLPTGRLATVLLSPKLLEEDGFGHLSVVNSDGLITLPENVNLTASPLGSINLTAANLTVQSHLSAPGGSLRFTTYNISPAFTAEFPIINDSGAPVPSPNPNRGIFTLDSQASLSVAGLQVDDRMTNPNRLLQPLVTNGGTLSILAYTANLHSGSTIDVSGGVAISARNSITYGKGGSLSILTGKDPGFTSVIGGRIELASTLSGYSGTTGGSLSIQATQIQIGGSSTFSNSLLLQPGFFRKGGFTSYSLEGIGAPSDALPLPNGPARYTPAIVIAEGSRIEPVAESWLAIPISPRQSTITLQPFLQPENQRSPVNLSFTALGSDDNFTTDVLEVRGDILVGSRAEIIAPPISTVSFKAQTISFLGSIDAPAGKITIAGAGRFPVPSDDAVNATFARSTVFIGPDSSFSANGLAILAPDAFQRRIGVLYPGGTIAVSGNIIASKGSTFNVSGSSTIFDLPPELLGNTSTQTSLATAGLTALPTPRQTVPVRQDSNGGTIDFQGSQMLATDATLTGRAGGPTAIGGTLSVFSGKFYPQIATQTGAEINLVVTQTGTTIAQTNQASSAGYALLDTAGVPLPGMGYFTIERFTEGGFSSLDLGAKLISSNPISFGGNLEFRGPISIHASANLRVAAGGVIQADSAVHLSSKYLALGQPFTPPPNPDDEVIPFQQDPATITRQFFFAPTFGTGSLTAQAELIDLGNLSFQNIGSVSLISKGDLRGNGTVQMAGDLRLQATQIYPTTRSTLNLFALDHGGLPGSVTIAGSGPSNTPLSAGGSINIFAAKISQNGTLRAPFGSIRLGWDGSDFDPSTSTFDTPFNPISGTTAPVPTTANLVIHAGSTTSVAAINDQTGANLLIPFGLSTDGLSWIDPRGVNVTTSGLPEKRLQLAGQSVTTESGSTLDLRGGGDLYAFRWTAGTGGSADLFGSPTSEWSASTDYSAGSLVSFSGQTWTARVRNTGQGPATNQYWTSVADSYAILPNFDAAFAPVAAYNTGGNSRLLGGDLGYVSNSLKIGDRIYLEKSPTLAAGFYTLLPRRYALLPGATLITPKPDSPLVNYSTPEGAFHVAGYRVNTFLQPEQAPTVRSQFEVAPFAVLRSRARYDDYLGNAFISAAAERLGIARLQRLPQDAGSLAIQGNSALNLAGQVRTSRPELGRGSSIDLSSNAAIHLIAGTATAPITSTAVLHNALIQSWGAESLLIGGLRRSTSLGDVVDVHTPSLTVDNQGETFSAPEILLVSQAQLIVADHSTITARGSMADPSATLNIVGDGALLRVSNDPKTPFIRTAATTSLDPLLSIGAHTQITGTSLTLDSTSTTQLDPTAILAGQSLDLGSGQISIVLSGNVPTLTGSVIQPHLVIAGDFSAQAQQAETLTLRSYRTIDLYGAGSFGSQNLRSLSLLASGLRGYQQGAATAELAAGEILLGNPANSAQIAPPATVSGTLELRAETIRLGSNTFSINGYQSVDLQATSSVIGEGTGTLTTPASLLITTPQITGARGSNHTITTLGSLALESIAGNTPSPTELGASFAFNASTLSANTQIILPSGRATLHASTGNLSIGGSIDLRGTTQEFYDLTRFSNGGELLLTADLGNVQLLPGSRISVSAPDLGGDAGNVTVQATQGAFTLNNSTLLAEAGAAFTSGSFALDVRSLPSFTTLSESLNDGGFFQSRHLRVRTGDIVVANAAGVANVARDFSLSTDAGSISVTGTIDASGKTGGKISLIAGGNLTVESSGHLTTHAEEFSSAGKGGEIHLEAGAAINGVANLASRLNLLAGSQIDLGVDEFIAGDYTTPGSSAFQGQFTGTLTLRAPRNATNSGLGVGPIRSTITDPSSILVEGYKITDLTSSNGLITGWRSTFTTLPTTGTTQRTIYNDANSFLSNTNANTITTSLLGADPQQLLSKLVLAPGVEIINRTGDLTLGSATSTALGSASSGNTSADWDLSDFRFGPNKTPGVLTLRAAGNIVLFNALSDGFRADPSGTPGGIFLPSGTLAGQSLWISPLMRLNSALPVNTQSWSLHLTAGADLSAADFHAVKPLSIMAANSGSVLLGKFYLPTIVNGATATTAAALNNRFQPIRTGTGEIVVNAARDIQLRNQFATIYTAGVRLPQPSTIFTPGDFVEPIVALTIGEHPSQGSLGAVQQIYPAQWSMAGGNLTLSAGADLWHTTQSGSTVIADSSAQLPMNWLYRRGLVDPSTGLFAVGGVDTSGPTSVVDPSASTAWWIDFSNFFQGVGALGGGDITLTAGSDIINVDAVIPTNARMAGHDPVTGLNLAPDTDRLLELGGGHLTIRTGDNLDGGIYYVERGQGDLFANGQITTNSSRSPSLGITKSFSNPEIFNSLTWLPTTFFLGKGSFDIAARGDVLVGPIANPFLLPVGLNNKFWYKSYFNTYSPDSSVDVSSFGGSVTHRLAVTLPGQTSAKPILSAWMEKQNLFQTAGATSRLSNWQPWIRLAESTITPFTTVVTILPPNLRSTAFAGDINLVGPVTLFPSPTGSLELAASKAIVGLQPTGVTQYGTPAQTVTVWTSSTINLSDADPNAIPNQTSPLGYQNIVGNLQINLRQTAASFLASIDILFNETGSSSGVAASIERKRALHSPSILHSQSTEPVRIYAEGGDITGFTLFSPKSAQIFAFNDITDVSFYIQNVRPSDVSIVSAGHDIVPYNENAPIRSLANNLALGNIVGDAKISTVTGLTTSVLAGDIQISGPGVLEVLAGHNLDLGTGANFSNGTGLGITSIGNFRNPFLPFTGADLIVLTSVMGPNGTGPAQGLSQSTLDFSTLDPSSSTSSPYLEKIQSAGALTALTDEQKAIVGLENFYTELRNTGRTFPTTGNYDSGLATIASLFGNSSTPGVIFTRARDIRTSTGGAISLGVPQGGLTLASDIFGNPLTPPGIVTEYGGAISLFTNQNVDIGQARIFTLRGGNILIWSSIGNIAAGSAPKTVVTAPPTRVVVDTTSADVQTDLGGLATGGGIGVLAAVEGVKAGDVDLIAPQGFVDAGDAGIRSTGNLTIAATAVLNASNIQVAGSASGVPSAPSISVPSIGALTQPQQQPTGGDAASQAAKEAQKQAAEQQEQLPSIVTVEVLGYGGDEGAETTSPP